MTRIYWQLHQWKKIIITIFLTKVETFKMRSVFVP